MLGYDLIRLATGFPGLLVAESLSEQDLLGFDRLQEIADGFC